jgi:hypothetical protein
MEERQQSFQERPKPQEDMGGIFTFSNGAASKGEGYAPQPPGKSPDEVRSSIAQPSLYERLLKTFRENPRATMVVSGGLLLGGYLLYQHLCGAQASEATAALSGMAAEMPAREKRKKRRFSFHSLPAEKEGQKAKASGRLKKKQDEALSATDEANEAAQQEAMAEEAQQESVSPLRKAGLHLLASFAGTAAAAVVPKKAAPIAGAGMALLGLYKKNSYLVAAGIGLATSGLFKQLWDKFMRKEETPAEVAAKATAAFTNPVVTPSKQTEVPAPASTPTMQGTEEVSERLDLSALDTLENAIKAQAGEGEGNEAVNIQTAPEKMQPELGVDAPGAKPSEIRFEDIERNL